MKIGIFGGSFNPVHNGHIHLAESAVSEFMLDKVYFVPSGISPHRSSAEYVSGADRLEMLRLASLNYPEFEVCDYEIKSERISYTYYTVEHFRKNFPDDELFLLIGSDMLMIFETWNNFEEIMKNTVLAVISRHEGDIRKLEEKAEYLSRYGKILIGKSLPVELSSTDIRKKIAKNQNFSCYLDENVVQYIRLKKLYK